MDTMKNPEVSTAYQLLQEPKSYHKVQVGSSDAALGVSMLLFVSALMLLSLRALARANKPPEAEKISKEKQLTELLDAFVPSLSHIAPHTRMGYGLVNTGKEEETYITVLKMDKAVLRMSIEKPWEKRLHRNNRHIRILWGVVAVLCLLLWWVG